MRAGDERSLTVEDEAAGGRLDQWLAGRLDGALSRNRIQGLIKAGAVTVGGLIVREPKHKLAVNDHVTLILPEPEPADPEGENIALDILFEDDHLIVLDKPAGMVVHPAAGNWTGTLVNALLHHCGDTLSGVGGVRRPGIVHRLDKDTSGVMVVAKSDIAHRGLAAGFADHGRDGTLERAYAAFAWGAPERDMGTIEAALGRSSTDRTRRAVVASDRPDARQAITHYKVIERYRAADGNDDVAALFDCRLETGRTHQIRVHLAHIGHPLIGDPDYGRALRTKANRLPEPARDLARAFPRQALHARLLGFRHPVSGETMRFETALPDDLAQLAACLRAP
ncbi:RluA family pseudouridine synthase [Nitratireductor sp. CAU 1489]|uniref:Pseudouridine synthase n=1 Tax=Nitratireductor arenosus TaxID=2682096 RepID=A0A844QBL4_9HYPH|nr:RluA family pseudouridine synthase [Nitratireductor arenosus]MVA96347.1 RluA family pseudouridine synthase [Nitratireductor arenosus]